MSDQEENDRQEAPPKSLTKIIGERIIQGYLDTESLFASASIHRVPQDLRKLNESAYTPRLIAIGPFHRDEPHLQTMQHVKMYYLNYLFFRSTEGIEDQGRRKFELLQQCVEKMKQLVDRAKKCYAEEVKVKHDDEMVEMMLVDGCFILELLYASYQSTTTKGGGSGNSKGSSSNLTAMSIKHDLLLLENQIPFFVLEELFKLTVDKIPEDQVTGGEKLSLTDYVISYFGDIMISPPDEKNSGRETKISCSPGHCVIWICGSAKENIEQEKKELRKSNDACHHILHLLHDYYGPGDQGEKRKPSGLEQNSALRCCRTRRKKFSELDAHASELDNGGVKFEPAKNFEVMFRERKGLCWWFHRATFKIPTLIIHDHTEPFLRNLIAFEQLHLRDRQYNQYFTSYAKLMDVLINSETDVQLLRKTKVIGNYLGEDKAVSDLFNKLCKEVVPGNFTEVGNFYFNDTCQKAYQYSKHWWPRHTAYWRRTYFASPWAFKTFCLALGLFVIQIMEILNTSTKIAADLGYLNNRNTTGTN